MQKKKKIFKVRFLFVTSRNLGCTIRICLSLSLTSPIGHLIKKQTSPTVSLSSLTTSIGNLHKNSSPTVSHSSLSFCCNKRTPSYADAAFFFLSQSRLAKICMRASLRSTNHTLTRKNVSLLHMQNTFSPILDSAVIHSFRYMNMCEGKITGFPKKFSIGT